MLNKLSSFIFILNDIKLLDQLIDVVERQTHLPQIPKNISAQCPKVECNGASHNNVRIWNRCLDVNLHHRRNSRAWFRRNDDNPAFFIVNTNRLYGMNNPGRSGNGSVFP